MMNAWPERYGRAWWRRLFVIFLLALLLAGCGEQIELLSGLPENDANEVLGVLLHAGIKARKTALKAGISIHVDQGAVASAIDVLQQQGLPRERRLKIGDIFKKESLISSPLEERARYLYALSQELEQTFSHIDGVVMARVHIVLPERVNPGEPMLPSSASVFLKYQADYGVDGVVSQVRRLVTNSIPGLAQDKVEVALVPATANPNAAAAPRLEEVFFIRVAQDSATALRMLLGGVAAGMVLVIAGAFYFVSRGDKGEPSFFTAGMKRIVSLRDSRSSMRQ